MNNLKLASGDNQNTFLVSISTDEEKIEREHKVIPSSCNQLEEIEKNENHPEDQTGTKNHSICDEVTLDIADQEFKLKERVAQCKSIIAALKQELCEEKLKLEKEAKVAQRLPSEHVPKTQHVTLHEISSLEFRNNFSYTNEPFGTTVDSKLNCDESLMEYEKQLQRYQNTLNMAQIEKKNAIRKQMLTKAYKLKLLEVENQCNIELLRVKQSLQCLEPLQMIVEKWKDTCEESSYDSTNFELIPRYPELYANSGSDINTFTDESNFKEFTNNVYYNTNSASSASN